MVQKIPPLSFRLGKSFNWASNVVTRYSSLDFIAGTAFEKLVYEVSYKLGRRKRFYVVRVSEKLATGGGFRFLMLYMPQIKRQARHYRWGPKKYRIFRFLLRYTRLRLRRYFWRIYHRAISLSWYVKKFRRRMNRWLTKRMFRGTWLAKKLTLKDNGVKKMSYAKVLRFYGIHYFSRFLFFIKLGFSGRRVQEFMQGLYVKDRKIWRMVYPLTKKVKKRLKRHWFLLRRYKRRVRKKLTLRKFKKYKFVSKKISKKKIRTRLRNKRLLLFNDVRFSEKLSKKLKKKIQVKSYNLFFYLLAKGKIGFRTHQRNYWNKKYKYQRYFYAHYYDIINAFWVIGLFDNYKVLCEIFKTTIPRFSKLKRFLFFLDRVTRAMRCIKKKFECFRIRWTGKITGSTKRTKTFKLGYGTVPYQTIKKKVRSLFYSYRHINGAFGVKFLVSYR